MHIHEWQTKYVQIEGYSVGSGMECDCGALLQQDDVEDNINHYEKLKAIFHQTIDFTPTAGNENL